MTEAENVGESEASLTAYTNKLVTLTLRGEWGRAGRDSRQMRIKLLDSVILLFIRAWTGFIW